MRVPDFEKLIQDTEDKFSPDDECLRNLIGVVLFLCAHTEGTIDSGVLLDLCSCDEVYVHIIKSYHAKYGAPPLVLASRDDVTVWLSYYDTKSMRDVAAELIGETTSMRPVNDFLRML